MRSRSRRTSSSMWPSRGRYGRGGRRRAAGLAVLAVEVPASAGRLVAFHEQVEAAALLAVEVLHHESLASVSPGAELVRVSEEQRALHQLDAVEPDNSRPLPLERPAGAERFGVGGARRCPRNPRAEAPWPHVVHLARPRPPARPRSGAWADSTQVELPMAGQGAERSLASDSTRSMSTRSTPSRARLRWLSWSPRIHLAVAGHRGCTVNT